MTQVKRVRSTPRRTGPVTRELPEEARQALWTVVDSRLWFLEMVAQDFDQQLEQIAQSLEADLAA